MQKVTDPALLSQLNGTTAAPAPRAPQQAPGVIMGRPKAPDPYRVEQDRINNSQEAERLRLAQDSASLQSQKDTLDIEKRQRDAAAGPIADAREGEANNLAFLGRARQALNEYDTLEAKLGGPRSEVGGAIASIPGGQTLLNALPDGVGDSPDRRRAERAARDFATNILRSDSGANAPEPEVDRLVSIYFPPPGETDPEVLQSYKQARAAALEGVRQKAGRLAVPGASGAPPLTPDNRNDHMVGATVLPNAALGGNDPGLSRNGVQDAATGGMRAVPEFRGMASTVQDMIQRGASADQVIAYMTERHTAAGFPPPNAARVDFINAVVRNHQARPDIPVGSPLIAQEWESLEMTEAPNEGGSLLGGLADTSAGAATIGAADVVTGGFLDEISGALGGNTDNARSVMQASADERPVSTLAGQFAGSALIPMGRGGQMAKQGAAFGGLYGAGSAEGNLDDRLVGAGIGALAGAGGGKIADKADGALAARSANRAARQTERNALLQDFTGQGVDALPANVGGAPTRVATSGAGQALFSSGSIRDAVERQAGQFGDAVNANARKAGASLPDDEAGALARKAGERFSKDTSARGSKLYERAETAAGDTRIVPQKAIDEIDAKIARLSQSPDESAKAFVKELQTFKKRLEGGVSIVGLRDARTRLSQGVYDGKLRSSADQRAWRDILGTVSQDIETGLRAAGKDRAAGMFKTADAYWSQRVDYIDEVLEPIIGKARSGEDILASIESMAGGKKGGVDRLRGLVGSLNASERGDLQASIITRLGKATAGSQNAEGEAFAATTFLTNWNKLSPKGKTALFGNSELRQSLDQLARVASNIKDVSRYTNTSNTAGAFGWQLGISSATAGVTNMPTAIMAAGGQYLTGKMLASPRFAAWLARAPKNASPAQAKAYVGRLKNIAATEPVIAADVNRFAQFLNAANDTSPAVAVASPEGQQKDN